MIPTISVCSGATTSKPGPDPNFRTKTSTMEGGPARLRPRFFCVGFCGVGAPYRRRGVMVVPSGTAQAIPGQTAPSRHHHCPAHWAAEPPRDLTLPGPFYGARFVGACFASERVALATRRDSRGVAGAVVREVSGILPAGYTGLSRAGPAPTRPAPTRLAPIPKQV